MLKAEDIEYLIWHITAGGWGTAQTIRAFHVAQPPAGRGWKDIGYHYVIQNGFNTFNAYSHYRPKLARDGLLEKGREDTEIGAHTKGWNRKSLGIAFIAADGHQISSRQIDTAITLTKELMSRYSVPANNVMGHYEAGAKKSCPELDMEYMRRLLV